MDVHSRTTLRLLFQIFMWEMAVNRALSTPVPRFLLKMHPKPFPHCNLALEWGINGAAISMEANIPLTYRAYRQIELARNFSSTPVDVTEVWAMSRALTLAQPVDSNIAI